jgi:hypothetical protein
VEVDRNADAFEADEDEDAFVAVADAPATEMAAEEA